MNRNLKQVLTYFDYFSYDPSFDEIHTFYPKKITKRTLQKLLDVAVKKQKCKSYTIKIINNAYLDCSNSLKCIFKNLKFKIENVSFYTLPQYSIDDKLKIKNQNEKSFKKIVRKVQIYLTLVSLLPNVRFMAITGSSAMIHTGPHGDLDLFVITSRGTLWLTRLLLVLLAKSMGIYGSHICLNLFFDSSQLFIHKKKQNVYVAHEILQMKPLVNKKNTLERFLHSNRWVYRLFPNSIRYTFIPKQTRTYHPEKASYLENVLKYLQMKYIRKNKTGMYIVEGQIWLFRSDFEHSLRKAKLLK